MWCAAHADPEHASEARESCGCPDFPVEACGHQIQGCPYERVPRRMWRIIQQLFRDDAWLEKGILPVAGGLDDQAAVWVDAIEILKSVEAHFMRDAAPQES